MANLDDMPDRSGGLSDAWFHRIKSATRDLVKACGTLERCEKICATSDSHISRWQKSTHPDIINVSAALALEADCGIPYVTKVMAELNGRRLSDLEADGYVPLATVHAEHAESMRAASEALATMASALADGKITPAEAEAADRAYAELATAVSRFRMSLAKLKTPLSAIKGGRGHD